MKVIFEKYDNAKKMTWEKLNLEAEHSTFLSSIDWIEFQKSIGKEIDQYFIVLDLEGKKIEIGILYIEIFRRKLIKYAYSPYQPVIIGEEMNDKEFEDLYSQIRDFMQRYIRQKELTLFRFDPLLPRTKILNFLNLGFKESLAPAQAKDTWEINLEQTDDEIRAHMSKSTRYNINKTSRSGIELVRATTKEHVQAFAELMGETTSRKGFGNYDFEYFWKQFEALNPKGMMDIFLARYTGEGNGKNKFTSGALVNYYKDTAYYTHGASTSNLFLAKLRSPYFLQWGIIRFLKTKGFKSYNMWGVIPDKKLEMPDFKHPLRGVSEYKKSFGGKEINYVGPLEVYDKKLKYSIHKLIDWWIYRNDRY